MKRFVLVSCLYCFTTMLFWHSAVSANEFIPNLATRIEFVDYPELPGYGTLPWKVLKLVPEFEKMFSHNDGKLRFKASCPVEFEKLVDNDALRQTLSFDYHNTADSSIRLAVYVKGSVTRKVFKAELKGSGSWEKTFTSPRTINLTTFRNITDIDEIASADKLLIRFSFDTGAGLDLSSVKLFAVADALTPETTPFFTAKHTPLIGIRLPENPDYWQIFAAERLRKYLFSMTGKMLPFSLGKTAENKINLGFAPPLELRNGPDNSYLVVSDNTIHIYGKQNWDLPFGVYELLKKSGIKFYTNVHQVIPKKEKLIFASCNVYKSSPFSTRHHAKSGDLLGMGYSSTKMYTPQFYNSPYAPPCHTNPFIFPAELYEKHPEYFALQNDGTRLDPRNRREQPLCFSHPDVCRMYKEAAREWLKKLPHAQNVIITAPDFHHWCVCSKCRSLDRKEGVYTHIVMNMLNEITHDVVAYYPNKKVTTYAYTYTSEPFDKLKLHPSLTVSYAFYKPFFASDSVNESYANIEGWRQLKSWVRNSVHGQLQGTLYPALFNARFSLTMPFDATTERIQWMRQHRFDGFWFNAVTRQFGHLMEYIWGELCWNENADIEQLIKEHTNFYYGPAAGPVMMKYFQRLRLHVKEKKPCQCSEYQSTGSVDKELLHDLYPLLEQSLAAVKPGTRAYRAISFHKAVLLYTELNDFNVNNAPLDNDYAKFAHKTAELIRLLGHQRFFTNRTTSYRAVSEWFSYVTGIKIENIKFWLDPVMQEFLEAPEQMVKPRELPVISVGKTIRPQDMMGGQFYPHSSHSRANICIRRQSSSWSVGHAAFVGAGAKKLVIHGQTELPAIPVDILLNGKSIYQGEISFPGKFWSKFTVTLPPELLHDRRNELEIRNLCADPPGNAPYTYGWIAICGIDVTGT